MTPQEQELILSVAQRLREAPLTGKDAQAEELIQREIGAQRDAPYLLTQAVILQEHALKHAQERITAMEADLEQARRQTTASSKGGFLGGLFGGAPSPAAPAPAASQGRGWSSGQGSGFGDFMKGAASVAVGVAGGHLLFSGLSNLFGDESAPGPEQAADGAAEASAQATELAESDSGQHSAEHQQSAEEHAFDDFDTGEEDF